MDKVVWHSTTIKQEQREKLLNQKPFVLWFTGYSASGKSTIANLVEKKMYKLNYKTYLLDGDNVRHGLNKDLGFDEESRIENIRRVGQVAKLFLDSGIIVITAFISPFVSDRSLVKSLFQNSEFLEVFIDTSLEVCEKRDPKGMYAQARLGKIKNFTGISSPYEPPVKPDIHVVNDSISLDEASNKIIEYLVEKKFIKKEENK